MSDEPRAKEAAEPSPAVQQARQRAQQLAGAFETVFGQPKKRTPEQQMVLEHLRVQAGEDSPSYQFSGTRDGISLIAAGIHRDGAKTILLIIDRQLQNALKDKKTATGKLTSVR